MATTVTSGVERRSAVRRSSPDLLPQVRVAGRHEARAIDVSAGGMLFETTVRLRPGSVIDLQIVSREHVTRVRGRVVRCSVSHLQPALVRYRAAVQFDAEVGWVARDTCGYLVPASSTAEQARSGEMLPAPSMRPSSERHVFLREIDSGTRAVRGIRFD